MIVAGLVAGLPISAAAAQTQFTIEAREFDVGNVRVSLVGQSYAGKYACIWHGDGSPDRAEYEIDFPVSADYTLWALYAAAQARPVEISLDGKPSCTSTGGCTRSS
jgi:hypothetical protein